MRYPVHFHSPSITFQAVSKLNTDVLPRVAAIETKGEEYRKQMKSLEDAVAQGEDACQKLSANTLQMELEKRRKTAEKIELEKDIVTWHLAQSEESEAQTRRWLQSALNKAEVTMQTQGQELKKLKQTHAAETEGLKDEVKALKDEIVSMNRVNKTMQEDIALKWRNLREEKSAVDYDREATSAREYKAQAELRIAQEDMAATKGRMETLREQVEQLTKEKTGAVAEAIEARRELQERVDYANNARMSRVEEIQADRMEGETRLRMELQATQTALHRLQQEKVEVSARLDLASNEATAVMHELVREQEANQDLRSENKTLSDKLKAEQDESNNLRGELSTAADDVINLQHELNTVLKVQAALRKENRELGYLNVKAVDYRQYMAPYDLATMGSRDSWAVHNDTVLGKYGGMQNLVAKYQNIKTAYGVDSLDQIGLGTKNVAEPE